MMWRCTRSLETGLLIFLAFIGSMTLNEALIPSIKMGIKVPISMVGCEGSMSPGISQVIVTSQGMLVESLNES